MEAAAHPLISHHLTVFEVTADSYWAVIALPLSLAGVSVFFARPLKCSQTLLLSLDTRGRGVSGQVPAKKALWVSVPSGTSNLLVSQMKTCAL